MLALLALLAAQVGTGLFSNNDIDFTGPWAAWVSDAWSARLTGWHHRLADALLILIGLHLLAIAWHAWVKKDNLVKPMWTGDKELEAGRAEPARLARWPTLAVALLAAVAAVVVASGPATPAPASPEKRAAPGW